MQESYAYRAVATYNAMQHWMYVSDRSSLYRETSPASGNQYAYLWPFSRALVGTLALAGVPEHQLPDHADYRSAVADRLNGLTQYWHGRAYDSYVVGSYGWGGDKYYDDNAWVSLALIQAYRMGFTSDLKRCQQLFEFARSGWDSSTNSPDAGGVFWVQQRVGLGLSNHDRGAGATAGDAELGFHLYELTGSSAYAGDGEPVARPRALGAANMVNWVATYLDSSRAGVGPFWNVVRQDGSIDTNVWSYNQGVMLGARLLQHRLSGELRRLAQAEAIAHQSLQTFGDFTRQPPSFNVMCFQNMLMLHAVSGDATLKANMLQSMQRYADWTWDPQTGARDPANDLLYFTDSGRPARGRQAARVQDQGAMLQLYALLAWDPANYDKLT